MVILGLGTNVEDRLQHLKQAVASLHKIMDVQRISPIYESDALLKPGSPPEWNVKYLNMAIGGKTNLSPRQLLDAVKGIEQEIGRKNRGIWAPREIDIDILLYNDEMVYEDDLRIPHIGLASRAFAMLPLADIFPEYKMENGKTAKEVASGFTGDKSISRSSLTI